ncbi:MAG: TetR/AcrR family transcriptional regulator [Candidatus Limnocylindrales bacterium]|jgi:AcrR family transcriptional regulator
MRASAAAGVVVADSSTSATLAPGDAQGERDVLDGAAADGAPAHVHHTAHGTEQQAALVRVAFDLIAERGFEGLRTRDVAAGAGLNIATLHYYFPTKEDLIRGVLAAAVQRFRTQEGSDPDVPPPDPLVQLRAFLRSRQRQMLEDPELFTVLLELSTRAIRDPAIRASMRQTDEEWRAHLAALLRAGVEAGVLRSDLDVPAAAAGLVALSKGVHLQMVMRPDGVPEGLDAETERWLTGRQA